MSRKLLFCLLLFSFSLAFLVQHARAAALPESGLDLVVLVDVSSSMFHVRDRRSREKKVGNDPTRLRWHAVKLLLDLLSDEDRVMILPFNEETPAVYQARSPEELTPGLSLLRGEERKELVKRIERLIHPELKRDDNEYYDSHDEELLTGILDALKEAKKRIEGDRAGQDVPATRKTVILLLTDGNESVDDKSAEEIKKLKELPESLKLLTVEGRKLVPVFTIGLGKADEELLSTLSSETSGEYYPAKKSSELIDILYNFVREQKTHWQWKPKLHGRETDLWENGVLRSSSLGSVIDMGVLCFIDAKFVDANFPDKDIGINTMPVEIDRLEWKPLNKDAKEDSNARIGSYNGQPAGYSYFYFDGRRTPGGRKGEFFNKYQSSKLELELEFDDIQEIKPILHVYFLKRTIELFELVEPRPGGKFYRYKPVPVVVRMKRHKIFDTKGFEVRIRVSGPIASGDAADTRESVEITVPLEPDGQDFKGTISFADLPASGDPDDYYTLAVPITGKSDPAHDLSGFDISLPGRTIRVENSIPLVATPRKFTLDKRTNPQQVIDIRPQEGFAFEGELPVAVKGARPKRMEEGDPFGVELPKDCMRQEPVPPATQAESAKIVLLKDGCGTIRFWLDPANRPPEGLYTGGKLTLETCGRLDSTTPLTAPVDVNFSVNIQDDPIKIEPAMVELMVKEGHPAASEKVVIRLDTALAPNAKPTGQERISLGICKSGGDEPPSGPFTESVLWLQRTGNEQRGQELNGIKLDEPVEVHVNLPIMKESVGTHVFDLVASGDGLKTTRSQLVVKVIGQMNFEPDPLTIEVGRDRPENSELVKVVSSVSGPATSAPRYVDIEIRRGGAAHEFPEQQLWLHRTGDQGKTQEMSRVRLGESINVHFAPENLQQMVGAYDYRLVARGEGLDETQGILTLIVKRPSEFDPDEVTLRIPAGEASATSEPITVKSDWPPPPGVRGEPITITLERVGDGDESASDWEEFSSDELWIEYPVESGLSIQRSKRQEIELESLGEPFKVHFKPKPVLRSLGSHRYRLVASGLDVETAIASVNLVVDPPDTQIDPRDPLPIYVTTGDKKASDEETGSKKANGEDKQSASFEARLKWLPGGELTFQADPASTIRFRPVPSEQQNGDNPPSKPVDENAAPNGGFDVGYSDLPKQIVLRPEEPATLKVTLGPFPKNLGYGVYDGRIKLRNPDLDEQSTDVELRFRLIVNSFYVTDPSATGRPTALGIRGRPVQGEVSVWQYFGARTTKTLLVSNKLAFKYGGDDYRLDPEKLVVAPVTVAGKDSKPAAELRIGDQVVSRIPAPKISKRQDVDENGNELPVVRVEFEFPERDNAHPGQAYRFDATLQCEEMKLKMPISFRLVFLEIRDAGRNRGQEEAETPKPTSP